MTGFPRNRPLKTRRRLGYLSLGVGTYLLALMLAKTPRVVETAYGTGVGPVIGRMLSSVTGLIPVSLAEVFIVAVLLRQLVPGTRAIRHVRAGQRQLKNAVLCGALRLCQDAGVLAALFYVCWGFNYARAPLSERLGWAEVRSASVQELADLSTQLVDAANAAYLELHGTEDAGTPTPVPAERRAFEAAIGEGWNRARAELALPPITGAYGRSKTPVATGLYETFGVVGFYFPFTGEANVRAGIPGSGWPQSLAHEKAHQRGVARESEANFWGFLAASHAPHPQARYSAYLFAQYQLLAALARVDTIGLRTVRERRLPGVQRDVDSARAYWRRLRGPGTDVGRVVNDAFLRTNRVPGGVHSYSRSALLFIAYARSRRGHLTGRP